MFVRCETCARHHRPEEPTCPFCRVPVRRATAAAAGLAALALLGCPADGPKPPPEQQGAVYGGPPPWVRETAPVDSADPTDSPVTDTTEPPEPAPGPTEPPPAPAYGAPPPR